MIPNPCRYDFCCILPIIGQYHMHLPGTLRQLPICQRLHNSLSLFFFCSVIFLFSLLISIHTCIHFLFLFLFVLISPFDILIYGNISFFLCLYQYLFYLLFISMHLFYLLFILISIFSFSYFFFIIILVLFFVFKKNIS